MSEKNYSMYARVAGLSVLTGAVGGTTAILLREALPDLKHEQIPDWITALTAIASAVISIIAVLLVARTLTATRETLDATQEIGDSQTRAWVYIETAVAGKVTTSLLTGEKRCSVQVTYKNFGNTPALEFSSLMESHIQQYPLPRKPFRVLETENDAQVIPPNHQLIETIFDILIKETPDLVTVIEVEWAYKTIKGQVIREQSRMMAFDESDHVGFRPVMSSDYADAKRHQNLKQA